MFYLFGVAITFFLILLLIGKKGKTKADIILACWLAVIGIHLSLFYLFLTDKIYSYPWLLGLHFPLPLMHGPFLYIYASTLINGSGGLFKKSILHSIPPILCYIYLISFILLPNDQKISVFRNNGKGYETFMSVLIVAIMVSGVFYITLTLLLHKRHTRIIVEQFSNTEQINLNWIQYLTYGIAAIWACVIFKANDEILFGAVVLFILFMGYFGIKQTPVFATHSNPSKPAPVLPDNNFLADDNPDTESSTKLIDKLVTENASDLNSSYPPDEGKGKYERSGLAEDDLLRIHGQLNELMKTKKIFTNPELTLGETASQLDIHPNYLSQVINSVTKKNFYDYINSYRVEEFTNLAMDGKNQKFTLLSLAYECGFNSKTSFNRNFRKVTGLSPSEYLKQNHVTLGAIN